jgi:hypothetical protein
MAMADTEPNEATEAAETAEANKTAGADRLPTDEEAAAADKSFEAEGDDERKNVAEHYDDMAKLGADIKGEGEIE